MYILGIDIGIINLGLVGCWVSEDYNLQKIDICKLVDITDLKCDERKCSLNHAPNIAFRMKHFFFNFQEYFDKADYIVIERQPIMGITDVQEIILYEYDHKCTLVSPNAMHKHFNIGDLDYEHRKKQTIKFSQRHLEGFKDFDNKERKHDMSDAMCLIKYFLYIKRTKYQQEKLEREWKKANHKVITMLDSFRFDSEKV